MSKKQFAETMAQELNRYFEENLTMEVHAAILEFVKTNDYTHYAIVLERPGVYPGFPNNHTSIQESSNNYCYFWRASNGLTPRSRYSCSCFIRTSPCAGAFPGSR